MAGIYLDPARYGDVTGKTPFADLRVVTDRKEETAWQIVPRRAETVQEEIPCKMQNLSLTGKGETWLELLPGNPGQ